jgi:hypothetical protein
MNERDTPTEADALPGGPPSGDTTAPLQRNYPPLATSADL